MMVKHARKPTALDARGETASHVTNGAQEERGDIAHAARQRIEDLERDNEYLKAQLADQRNAATTLAGPLPAQPNTPRYRMIAIVMFVLAVLFLIAALWLYFGRVRPLEDQLSKIHQERPPTLLSSVPSPAAWKRG